MHLTLGALPSTQYLSRHLGTEGKICHDLLLQRLHTGETELVLVMTCGEGGEAALEEIAENGRRKINLSIGPSGNSFERVSTGWGVSPGDARAVPRVRMVTYTAILPAAVEDVTLQAATLAEPCVADLTGTALGLGEVVRNSWSLAYAVVNDAIYARVRRFTQAQSLHHHFHIDTQGELGGAQYDFEEEHVTARLVSWAPLETFLSYTVEGPIAERQ